MQALIPCNLCAPGIQNPGQTDTHRSSARPRLTASSICLENIAVRGSEVVGIVWLCLSRACPFRPGLTNQTLLLSLLFSTTTGMLLTAVPVEVLEEIFRHVLFARDTNPTALLRTNKLIYEICNPMLHSDLVFSSQTQLSLFASQCLPSVPPRTLSLSLPGAFVESTVFSHLHDVLSRCLQCFPTTAKLHLNAMRFCLNSHPLGAEALFQALSLTECVDGYSIFHV